MLAASAPYINDHYLQTGKEQSMGNSICSIWLCRLSVSWSDILLREIPANGFYGRHFQMSVIKQAIKKAIAKQQGFRHEPCSNPANTLPYEWSAVFHALHGLLKTMGQEWIFSRFTRFFTIDSCSSFIVWLVWTDPSRPVCQTLTVQLRG